MADNFRENYADELQRAMDPFVHALTVVQETHRMVHDGFVYHTSGKVTGLTNGATADFLMSTSTIIPHITRVQLSVGAGDIDLVMYEGVTTSDDGAALTVLPTNRNTTNTNASIPYGGPTITDLGTTFHTIWVPPTSAGVGNKVGVMDIVQGEEWILKPSTKYGFRITNNSGGTISYAYEFVWYEPNYTL